MNGKWVGGAIECKPVDCGNLAVANGFSSCPATTLGAECTFSCSVGYEKSHDDHTFVCEPSGKWSAQAKCVSSSCPPKITALPTGAVQVVDCPPYGKCDLTNLACASGYNVASFKEYACTSGAWAGGSISCSPCTANQFRDVTKLGCQNLTTVCPSGTYQSAPPTVTSDRICTKVRVCVAGEYESVKPTTTSNRVCTAAKSSCLTGQYQLSAPTFSADRVCVTCPMCVPGVTTRDSRACTGGVLPEGLAPSNICKACKKCGPTQFYLTSAPCTSLRDSTCQELTVCPLGNSASGYEIDAPTNTTDRKCGAIPASTASVAADRAVSRGFFAVLDVPDSIAFAAEGSVSVRFVELLATGIRNSLSPFEDVRVSVLTVTRNLGVDGGLLVTYAVDIQAASSNSTTLALLLDHDLHTNSVLQLGLMLATEAFDVGAALDAITVVSASATTRVSDGSKSYASTADSSIGLSTIIAIIVLVVVVVFVLVCVMCCIRRRGSALVSIGDTLYSVQVDKNTPRPSHMEMNNYVSPRNVVSFVSNHEEPSTPL